MNSTDRITGNVKSGACEPKSYLAALKRKLLLSTVSLGVAAVGVPTIGVVMPEMAAAACSSNINSVTCTGNEPSGISTTIFLNTTVNIVGTATVDDTIQLTLPVGNNLQWNMLNPSSRISGNGGHGISVITVVPGSSQVYQLNGMVTSTDGNAVNVLMPLGGTVNMTLGATSILNATGIGDTAGVPTSGGGVVIVSVAGAADLTLNSNGIIRAENDGVYMTTGIGSGTATVNNTGEIGQSVLAVGGNGVNITGAGNAVVNNEVDGEIHADENGIQIGGPGLAPLGGSATVKNLGLVNSVLGTGVNILAAGSVEVMNSGEVDALGRGISAVSLGGAVTIDGYDDGGGMVYGSVRGFDGPGIYGAGLDDVTIDSGSVLATGNLGAPVPVPLLGLVPVSGGVIGASLAGNTMITTYGNISTDGQFGALGISTVGNSTVTVKGGIGPLILNGDAPAVGAASIVYFGSGEAELNVDPGSTVNAEYVGLLAVNGGEGEVDINADPTSVVNAGAIGVLGVGLQDGNVNIDSGIVNVSGANAPILPLPPLPGPLAILNGPIGGGVLGASFGGGDVVVNTEGKISVTAGLFGAGAISNDGNATLNINAAIDPPAIGGFALTFGAGTATVNANALVEANVFGLIGANIGSGDVNITVDGDAQSGEVRSDGIGIVALNGGGGDVTVNSSGAIGGLIAGSATGSDGIYVRTNFGGGDVSVATTRDGNPLTFEGSINAGEDGIDIWRRRVTGLNRETNVSVGADIDAVDTGVRIWQRGPGEITTKVDVGPDALLPVAITATNGNGIDINSRITGTVDVNVGEDSSVIANNGSAVRIVNRPASSGDVTISNGGIMRGEGNFPTATVRSRSSGSFTLTNESTGMLVTEFDARNGDIVRARSDGTSLMTNNGTMYGNVFLRSDNSSSTVNNGNGGSETGTWETSGTNRIRAFGAAATDSAILNNLEDGSGNDSQLTTFGVTRFVFASANGERNVNNSGEINVNGRARFGAGTSGLDTFNNNDGLIDMVNGVVGGFGPLPFYNSGVGDLTIVAGDFTGGGTSELAIDALLGGPAPISSSADVLLIAGDVSNPTSLTVNDFAPGPNGQFNPTGLAVVGVVSGNTALGDFTLNGGPIDKGLFTYDLFLDDTPAPADWIAGYAPDKTWVLASYPDGSAFVLPQSISIAQGMWHTTADSWIDRASDLRDIFGSDDGATDVSGYGPLGKNPAPVFQDDEYGAWMRTIGLYAESDVTQTFTPFPNQPVSVDTSYTEKMFGIQGGIDRAFEQKQGTLIVGVLGGWAYNDVDFTGAGDSGTFKGPQVGIYSSWVNNGFYLDGLFKADFLDADLTISGVGVSTDAVSLGGRVETGYRKTTGNGYFIEPVASLAYVNTQIDDVTVLGAPVTFDDGESLRGKLGGRVGGSFNNDKALFEPYISAFVGNEFLGDNSTFLASGPGLTITDDVSGVFGEVGTGFNARIKNSSLTVFGQANFIFAEDYKAGNGKLGMRVNW